MVSWWFPWALWWVTASGRWGTAGASVQHRHGCWHDWHSAKNINLHHCRICLKNIHSFRLFFKNSINAVAARVAAESQHQWATASKTKGVPQLSCCPFGPFGIRRVIGETVLCTSMGNYITFWSRNKNESSLDESCVWMHCCWSIICICVFFISLGEQWCSLRPWIRMFLHTLQLESY